jgi:nitric oxide reductase NorD protein
MAIDLDEYRDLLDELGEHAEEVLRGAWEETARVFSPRGLVEYYLRAALNLKALGRGSDLVVSFLESAPAVARALGEDAVRELVSAAIAMYSKTSASVIAAVIQTSPIAAERLGDPELFRSYLGLIDQLLAAAPRGVRPMLDRLEVLLGQLTLGGLRRWALWGAQAHKFDFDTQVQYFSLATPDALAVLQRERKGTLFIDVQRRLGMYLRALWGRDFFLRPESGDFDGSEVVRPSIEGFIIHLPDAYDDLVLDVADREPRRISGLELYRAAAAHAAAHQVASRRQLDDHDLDTLERTLAGLLEDARVEAASIARFPGLATLWRPHHVANAELGDASWALLARGARALADPDYSDTNPWVQRVREVFDAQIAGAEALDAELVRLLASELRDRAGGLAPSDVLRAVPLYRDDNAYLFEFKDVLREQLAAGDLVVVPSQVRKYVNVMEMINEVDVPNAGDDAEEIWVLATEFFRDGETESVNAQEGREPPPEPYHYPEWDYQLQLERPNWCTVLEKRAGAGDPALVEAILVKHRPLVARLRLIIEALQPQGLLRIRKQEDGDELDINAAVAAMVDRRLGTPPDLRVMLRTVRKVRDISVLVLIDLSESTNDVVFGSDQTVLELAREAVVLLAESINRIGDPFALHGFDSNGRHDVEYFRFKDFADPYDERVRAHLAGMTGQLSTRMGAAIRHAGSILARQPQTKRLLLVVTDGEPADNDVRDPQYLRWDARKAVEEVQRLGISTFCLSLDPRADEYVSRIFGPTGYVVLDNVVRLPERLPLLYAGLTR